MLAPADAEAAIAAALPAGRDEPVALAAAAGRVLAEDVHAERDAPPFDRVTMDGVALASAEYRAGRREFIVAGVQPAGVPPARRERPGDCLEAMTGAVLPAGCDAVVPVEQLVLDGGRVRLADGLAVAAGLNVHARGSDARAGDRLLAAGDCLGPAELAIVASAGRDRVRVRARPRIAVASTGDELVEPGGSIAAHQVRRSNPYALGAALARAGWPATTDRHFRDDPAALRTGLGALLADHDVLVLSGGVSAGRYDHVPAALAAAGVRCVFHRVAQRPGKPLWFGVGPAGQLVFALPGNPVSVLACLARYVLPALARLEGRPSPLRTLRLAAPVDWPQRLAALYAVAVEHDADGAPWARPRAPRLSGDFVALAGCAGVIELPAGPAVYPAGSRVLLYPW